jgi:hypothetical protein
MVCRHVDAVRKRFRDSIYPGIPLPPSYNKTLGALELLLVNQVIHIQGKSPGGDPDVSLSNAIGFLKRKTSVNTQESLIEDLLAWRLVRLEAKPDDQWTFDHAMLFAMLQDHLFGNPSERKRLDEITYQTLSDPSTCHEMPTAVRFHRPQNAARTVDEVKATEDRESWKLQCYKHRPQLEDSRCL